MGGESLACAVYTSNNISAYFNKTIFLWCTCCINLAYDVQKWNIRNVLDIIGEKIFRASKLPMESQVYFKMTGNSLGGGQEEDISHSWWAKLVEGIGTHNHKNKYSKDMESKCKNIHQMKAAFFFLHQRLTAARALDREIRGKHRISTEGEVLPRHPTGGKFVYNERCSSRVSSPSFLHSLLLIPVHPSCWQNNIVYRG